MATTRKPSARKSRAVKRRVGPTEEQIQVALFRWASVMQVKRPRLRLMFAVPNGMHSDPRHVRRHKAAGLRPGVPDVWLPAPTEHYAGLVIELKSATGTVSAEQDRWLRDLRAQGYCATVCRGLDEAIQLVEDYLSGKNFLLPDAL